ncbi:MAG TPA: HAMP domain-containing sensor histidine kinase [Dermatophilaceae bacterium]|nr:HAMP domain-containing sensor histidine kinase [Dermatophilaceae bacterium]
MTTVDRLTWRRLFRPSAWTLRSKLVASTVALFMAVSLTTGLVAVVALKTFLMQQLQEQVEDSADRQGVRPGLDGDRDPQPLDGRGGSRRPAPGPPPGLGGGFLHLTLVDGVATSNVILTGDAQAGSLTDDQVAAIQHGGVGTHATEVDLGGQLGTYLLVASHSRVGSNATYVTGLPTAPVTTTVNRLALIFVVLNGVGLVAVGVGGAWLVRTNLRPLRRVAATATRVSNLPLASGEVALAERVPAADTDPRTEIGQVGAALNGMLDHVGAALEARHESEQRVRQFVADASHELRTPLASIRGYAELSRREPEPVPEGVVHALSRVEAEAVRMTSLVDDLLLLARLDAGRPLQREPVDLALVAVDAVSDAHAASPEHVWQLEVPDEAAVVEGDSARLHQVVANLLANARTHTPRGTLVKTRVATVDGEVLLTVTDNGPGVPAALQPNVFQRFARGDASRNRADGSSTGLGLSIVQAVAQAHHGRVDLESRPGLTRFTVALPAH